MSNMQDIEIVLDGIKDELMRIRKIFERQEQQHSMILQKVANENTNARLF